MKFTFHNPTRIHFGEDQITKINRELPTHAKVLVIYGGGSIKSNGVYDQVKSALSDRKWFEFSGIEPNPKYETAIKAVDMIKKHDIDYLLAVGGGSVIDATKFIAAAAMYEGDDSWDILAKQIKVKQALPFGVVLTLPATGSESNAGSVMTRGQDKLFFAASVVFPVFAVLDPLVTLSLPDRQISNGVVDAFVHVLEQYLTYPVDGKIQDRFAEGLLQTLIEEGPLALTEEGKGDINIRGNIMWSATLALNGLIVAGVPEDWTTHMIGHELTALYGIDHARSLSIIAPAVMKVCKKSKHEKLIQYGRRVWGLDMDDKDQLIDLAIDKTIAFFQQMLVPTSLGEAGVKEHDIELIINQLQKHGMTALGEHQANDLVVSREILQMAL